MVQIKLVLPSFSTVIYVHFNIGEEINLIGGRYGGGVPSNNIIFSWRNSHYPCCDIGKFGIIDGRNKNSPKVNLMDVQSML